MIVIIIIIIIIIMICNVIFKILNSSSWKVLSIDIILWLIHFCRFPFTCIFKTLNTPPPPHPSHSPTHKNSPLTFTSCDPMENISMKIVDNFPQIGRITRSSFLTIFGQL